MNVKQSALFSRNAPSDLMTCPGGDLLHISCALADSSASGGMVRFAIAKGKGEGRCMQAARALSAFALHHEHVLQGRGKIFLYCVGDADRAAMAHALYFLWLTLPFKKRLFFFSRSVSGQPDQTRIILAAFNGSGQHGDAGRDLARHFKDEMNDEEEFERPAYARRHSGTVGFATCDADSFPIRETAVVRAFCSRILKKLRKSAGQPDVPPEILYPEVVAFARAAGTVSISMIQRKFRIGFNQCARFMEQLEKDGIIGPAEDSKPRRVVGRLAKLQ